MISDDFIITDYLFTMSSSFLDRHHFFYTFLSTYQFTNIKLAIPKLIQKNCAKFNSFLQMNLFSKNKGLKQSILIALVLKFLILMNNLDKMFYWPNQTEVILNSSSNKHLIDIQWSKYILFKILHFRY